MNNSTSHIVSTKELFSGKWIRFKTAEHRTRDGSTYTYEYVERTTRKGEIDGAYVIGLLHFPASKKPTKIILIAGYRPPVDKYVLEFPSGLIDDPNDCIKEAARELKEETGYTAKRILEVFKIDGVPQISPDLYIDPWKSTETEKLVILEVDGDDEVNQNVKQELESNEDIHVHLFDITSSLWADIVRLAKEKGYVIESKLFSLITGMMIGRSLADLLTA